MEIRVDSQFVLIMCEFSLQPSLSVAVPLTAGPWGVSVQEPVRGTPSALIQHKDQSVFIVQNVVINMFGNQKEYLPISAAAASATEGGLCLPVYTPTWTGANVFILSREVGECSSEFERGANTLAVVPDSQNLFRGTPTTWTSWVIFSWKWQSILDKFRFPPWMVCHILLDKSTIFAASPDQRMLFGSHFMQKTP